MKCKYCQQELDKGVTLCPECGRDNADPQAFEVTLVEGVAPEKTVSSAAASDVELTEKPVMGKMAIALGILVALAVVLCALILGGREKPDVNYYETEPSQEITELTEGTEPTAAPTCPADTGLNDATCKGNYTVSDDILKENLDTVVATMGDEVMTVADLQVYYWLQVREFMESEDFYYMAYYYGLIDPALPLECQMCYYDDTLTWQQYFVNYAIESWQQFVGMAVAARENNVEMEETLRADLDGMEASLTELAQNNEFASVQDMLEFNMGPGATFEAYYRYMEVYYLGYSYYMQAFDSVQPDEAAVNAYYEENKAAFEAQGLFKEVKTVDVRHVLIMPGDDPNATSYTEEQWATAETKAQALLNGWLAGEATEEAFAQMANDNSTDPGSNTNGGLYTGVTQGQMVPEFNDWCFDEARQVGDTGIVKTTYGYHIMYFVGSQVTETEWYTYAENELRYDTIEEEMDAVVHKYELVTEYSKAMLGSEPACLK
jgi:hypothetical protein